MKHMKTIHHARCVFYRTLLLIVIASYNVADSGSVKYSTIVDIFPSKKGEKSVRVTLFYPIVITMGKNSEGYTVLPPLNNREEQ